MGVAGGRRGGTRSPGRAEPRQGSADCLVRAHRARALGLRAQIRRARHLGRRSTGAGDPVRGQTGRRIPAHPPRT